MSSAHMKVVSLFAAARNMAHILRFMIYKVFNLETLELSCYSKKREQVIKNMQIERRVITHVVFNCEHTHFRFQDKFGKH